MLKLCNTQELCRGYTWNAARSRDDELGCWLEQGNMHLLLTLCYSNDSCQILETEALTALEKSILQTFQYLEQ